MLLWGNFALQLSIIMFEKLSDCISYYQQYHLTKHKYDNRKKALAYFDDIPLQDIRKHHIKRYHALRSQVVSNATINREISFARASINCVNRDYELTLYNAFTDIKFLESDVIPCYLTIDEVNRLLEMSKTINDTHLHDFLALLVYTGARPIELLTLTWENVYLDRRFYVVRNYWSKNKRTMYKYLNDIALDILANRQRIGEYVFTNPATGERYYDFKNQFKTCKKLAKVNCRMYDLRHTYASWLVQKGVPIYTVKDLLGHRDISSTERYAHLDYATYIEALNKII